MLRSTSIRGSICPSAHPSVCPSIHPSIYPSAHPSVRPSCHRSRTPSSIEVFQSSASGLVAWLSSEYLSSHTYGAKDIVINVAWKVVIHFLRANGGLFKAFLGLIKISQSPTSFLGPNFYYYKIPHERESCLFVF